MTKLRFSEIEANVQATPGYYEIHTDAGLALKVGISSNLLSRLKSHRSSLQSCLKCTAGGDLRDSANMDCGPGDVRSKKSILAKHLYFDETRALEYDYQLKTQTGRRQFLDEQCYILFRHTQNKAEARVLELTAEEEERFLYVGLVIVR